jgi:transcription termination factor Rho
MSVLDRDALEQSPLADLHAIASELSLDGYRRLRREELIDAILAKQGDGPAPAAAEDEAEADEERPRRRRSRRGGRGRAARDAGDEDEDEGAEAVAPEEPDAGAQGEPQPEADEDEREPAAGDEIVEGEVDLLPNGSAFMRVHPPEPSDDDVYVSAAQVRRCELVSGDSVTGPRRAPRRSERFASLVRIDTINGRPASEIAEGARWDDLPSAFPEERFKLGTDDRTINAIEWLTPIGKGSRVTIVGAGRAGKTEALRRLAAALVAHEGELQLFLALAGVRPEEISEWNDGPVPPTTALSFAASPDAQAHSVELVLDRARRAAARGGDAVVLIDTLDWLPPHAALKIMAAARNIVDGGSLTVLATARAPIGGETTVIALDARLVASGRFPALDLVASGSLRPERLVGDAGAAAIARARAIAEDEEQEK